MRFLMRGLTLIELLLCLTIISILSVIGFGSLQTMMQHQREQVWQNQLIHLIDTARQAAYQQAVTLNLQADKQTWLLQYGEGEKLFSQRISETPAYFAMQVYPKHQSYFFFSAKELEKISNGSIWLCPKKAAKPTWALAINDMGRVKILSANRQGEIKDSRGKLLFC